MSDFVVEVPSFEEDLLNNRIIMLNHNGVKEVVNLVLNKNKEIEELHSIINKAKHLVMHNDTYDYRVFNEMLLSIFNKEK